MSSSSSSSSPAAPATPSAAASTVAPAFGGERIDPDGKGIGAAPDSATLADVPRLHWHLLREEVSLPAAVLYRTSIEHNLAWMHRFVAAYDVDLAPHGKTTMCPALFARQIEAGAWGITLATASQMRAAARHGVRRMLMANQLIGRRNMAIVADLLRGDFEDGAGLEGQRGAGGNDTAGARPTDDAATSAAPSAAPATTHAPAPSPIEAFVIVDSADNVAQLGRFFRERGQRIAVLIELGAAGGRTGVRDAAAEEAVLAAIAEWRDAVTLAGVEVYEGVLPDEASIRVLLRRAVATVERLAREGRFPGDGPVVLSGAGSAWFDVVAEELTQAKALAAPRPVQVLLRPGCYVTHDVGAYKQAQARMEAANTVVRELGDGLRPAMHVWAYVQSRPEPTLAIVGLGKRDVAFDSGMPAPALHFRPAGAGAGADVGADAAAGASTDRPSAAPADWTVARMMDQHAYMTVPADADLRIGDMIAFDISHPCLTWDKWRQVAVLDDDYRVVDLLQTYF